MPGRSQYFVSLTGGFPLQTLVGDEKGKGKGKKGDGKDGKGKGGKGKGKQDWWVCWKLKGFRKLWMITHPGKLT